MSVVLWDNITELYHGIVLRDNITELYHRIILRDNITESYHRIVWRGHITKLYYGIILQDHITEPYYGTILWNYITDSSLWKVSRGCLGRPLILKCTKSFGFARHSWHIYKYMRYHKVYICTYKQLPIDIYKYNTYIYIYAYIHMYYDIFGLCYELDSVCVMCGM